MTSKPKTKRGGSRPGAGRKPILLTQEQRLVIGELCENRCTTLEWEAATQKHDQNPLMVKLAAERARLKKKAASLGWSQRKLAVEMTGLRDRVWGRRDPGYVITVRRLYGRRAQVISWVIEWSNEKGVKFGPRQREPKRVKLSARLVDECWKEFRREKADIASLTRERLPAYGNI